MYSVFLTVSAAIEAVCAYGVFKGSSNDNQCCSSSPYQRHLPGATITSESCVIGPPCTMEVHNNYTDCVHETCPGEGPQPAPGPFINDTPFLEHFYEDHFVMDFKVYLFDSDEFPPRIPGDNVTHSIAYGRTFYDIDVAGGFMRESYYNRCLPIFPGSPLDSGTYSCDFYTLNDHNTAYTVFHDDKPEGAPNCCVLGNPFRCPPQDFFEKLPVRFQSVEPFNNAAEPGTEDPSAEQVIDWRTANLTATMKEVAYGFVNEYNGSRNVPFAFLFRGGPWVANAGWCYQRFYHFEARRPSVNASVLPASCLEDEVTWCPGWEPWRVEDCGAPQQCSKSQESDTMKLLAAIGAGSVLFVVAICAMTVWFVRKKKNRKRLERKGSGPFVALNDDSGLTAGDSH